MNIEHVIELLEALKNNAEDITISEEKDTKYGAAIIRKKIGVIKVSDIDELIKQLKGDE